MFVRTKQSRVYKESRFSFIVPHFSSSHFHNHPSSPKPNPFSNMSSSISNMMSGDSRYVVAVVERVERVVYPLFCSKANGQYQSTKGTMKETVRPTDTRVFHRRRRLARAPR